MSLLWSEKPKGVVTYLSNYSHVVGHSVFLPTYVEGICGRKVRWRIYPHWSSGKNQRQWCTNLLALDSVFETSFSTYEGIKNRIITIPIKGIVGSSTHFYVTLGTARAYSAIPTAGGLAIQYAPQQIVLLLIPRSVRIIRRIHLQVPNLLTWGVCYQLKLLSMTSWASRIGGRLADLWKKTCCWDSCRNLGMSIKRCWKEKWVTAQRKRMYSCATSSQWWNQGFRGRRRWAII